MRIVLHLSPAIGNAASAVHFLVMSYLPEAHAVHALLIHVVAQQLAFILLTMAPLTACVPSSLCRSAPSCHL